MDSWRECGDACTQNNAQARVPARWSSAPVQTENPKPARWDLYKEALAIPGTRRARQLVRYRTRSQTAGLRQGKSKTSPQKAKSPTTTFSASEVAPLANRELRCGFPAAPDFHQWWVGSFRCRWSQELDAFRSK